MRIERMFLGLLMAGMTCISVHASVASEQTDSAKYNPFCFEEETDEFADTTLVSKDQNPDEIGENTTHSVGEQSRNGVKTHAPISYAIRFTPGTVLALDQYVKTWLKDKQTYAVSAELSLDTYNMYDGNASYAADYNYPSFSFGVRYNFNHGTTMHRDAADWGEKLEVPYTTHLGDILTLYGRFDRPLFRTRRWSGGYSLGTGVGVAMSHYDKERHIDNELIGTRLNIFFTTGLFVKYQFARTMVVEAGVDFSHHSNGALYRPNKGANYLGPFIGLRYTPEETFKEERRERRGERERLSTDEAKGEECVFDDWRAHPWQLELSLGVGAKTLNEQWQQTQFYSQPTDPDFRTEDFAVYGAFSLQADVLYRYARRWATGLGLDLFYGDYASRVARYEENRNDHVSPWSLGLAVKHEAHYGRLTARVGFGVYLFRRMGTLAKAVEQPYYERVGLFYTLDRRSGLAAGFSVNAHRTKADFTELSLSIPIRL